MDEKERGVVEGGCERLCISGSRWGRWKVDCRKCIGGGGNV